MTATQGLRVVTNVPNAFRSVAVTPRPVRLGAPAQRRPTPYRRPAFTPAMLASTPKRPRMGALSDVPLSLGIGATGLGALLLSGILPTPVKTIAQVTGIGLIAFAAITLVTPAAEAKTTEQSLGPEPIGEESTFGSIMANIVEPSYNSSTPLGFLSSDYDVKAQWTNPTDQPFNVDFQVYVEETPIWTGLFGDSVGTPYRSVAHSGRVNLLPNSKETVKMEIPVKNPEGTGDATLINLSIRKVWKGEAVEVAKMTFTAYANAIERWMTPSSYF